MPYPGSQTMNQISRQNLPGDGDNGAPAEYAHYGGHQIPVQGGVDGQIQLMALQPREELAQQRGQAKGNFYSGVVWAAVKPLSQMLAQSIPDAHRHQGGDYRVLNGAFDQKGAYTQRVRSRCWVASGQKTVLNSGIPKSQTPI